MGPPGSVSGQASTWGKAAARRSLARIRRPDRSASLSAAAIARTGALMSIAMFRELVAPYLREMVDLIHGLGARVFYHSCGAIAPFIPELIAMGVDLLDPLQPVNAEMQPESLQARFGGQVCFHGGIDMQGILPYGTPEEVRAEARRYCEVLGSEGGYVLAPTHLFQPDVPPGNIVAMYEE